MNITLHPYRDADLEALAGLMCHWWEERTCTAGDLKPSIAALYEKSDNEILLARDERGVLLGYAQIGPVYLLGHEPFYEIMQLLVDKNARDLGVGTAMLAEIEKLVLGRGFRSIRLSSRLERADAHRFYRRNGYVEHKTSRFFEKNL